MRPRAADDAGIDQRQRRTRSRDGWRPCGSSHVCRRAPLNRLFYDTGRRQKNRDTAQTACRRYDPNVGHAGLDCDEDPFAATYQGCAQHMYDSKAPVDDYSAKMLDSTENQLAGSQLAQFYNNERIIDYQNEDGFTVQIIG